MKNKLFLAGLTIIVFSLLFASKIFAFWEIPVPTFPNQPEKLSRKIVVFKPEVSEENVKDNLVRKFGGEKIKNLRLINSQAVVLSSSAETLLAKEPGVLRVDDDVVVEALPRRSRWVRPTKVPKPTSTPRPTSTPKPTSTPAPTATPTATSRQTLPWGIDRIDAEMVWNTASGSGIKIAIIDTGIDTKHPDLIDNLKGGVSTVGYTSSYNDDSGHGTHVAGIAAALNNNFGVVGVGPQIDLYGVKVLDRRGSGYLSDVIEGLDWAVANGVQVVNMSLGTSSDIQSFHDAVQRVNTAGIVQVAAAGNSGGAVIYPAAYSEVVAVSATDQADAIASWSSRGPEVDLAAPGVSIYSTYKGQTYKTLSGTSMASPHVAGTAALVLSVPRKCDLDLDGKCSPFEVIQRLETTAEDLGAVGKDNLFGAGLVDAEKAVLQ